MGTTPPATADHLRFDEEDFAERYLAGRLAPEEAAAFEVHYLDCEACLDRLAVAQRLRDGLAQIAGPIIGEERRTAAEKDATRHDPPLVQPSRPSSTVAAYSEPVGPALSGALARLGRSRQLGLALAAVLVVALLPAGLLWREVGRLRSDLAAAERQAAPSPARPQADPLAAELADARRELAEQRGQLDALRTGLEQAEAAAAERARLAAELAGAHRPQANPPILTLGPERGGSDSGDEPSSRVTLTDTPEWVVLFLELGEVQAATDYHATLRKGGAGLWQGTLTPDARGDMVLAVPSAILTAGVHTVEVRAGKAAAEPVAQFRFQVRRR